MYILLTNDDGISSPGLLALRNALNEIGETVVVAPDRNWSAAGRYRKLFDPLRVSEGQLADGSPALACDGTPSDCIALALMGLLERRPDLVVAGINLGANLGNDVLYSGTVAAALEAMAFGVPGIAVSLRSPKEQSWDFRAAGSAAARLVDTLQHRGRFSDEVLLNLNIPPGPPETIRGTRVTRLGRRTYRDELIVRHDPRGRPYYWIGGAEPEDHHEAGTDVAAIADGYISITPVYLDLTGHHLFDELRGWGLEE